MRLSCSLSAGCFVAQTGLSETGLSVEDADAVFPSCLSLRIVASCNPKQGCTGMYLGVEGRCPPCRRAPPRSVGVCSRLCDRVCLLTTLAFSFFTAGRPG